MFSLFKDKNKSILQHDEIDIIQWEINLKYLNSAIRSPDQLSVTEFEAKLIKDTTSEVKKIKKNLAMPIDYPLELQNNKYFWYIAAYPDVIDYFYPSPTYGVEDFEKEKARVKIVRKKSDKDYKDFEELILKGHKHNIDYNQLLLLLKDYYHEILKNEFLLSEK
jgi:hypothetical protein